MSLPSRPDYGNANERALSSGGTSSDAIHEMVVRAINQRGALGGWLVDVGCGTGAFWKRVAAEVERYTGIDLVDYETNEFEQLVADLNLDPLPLPDGVADLVTAIEVVEHLENPRRFVRELTRIAKPGGWIVLTTPNQLSLLSLGTLFVKGHFSAFQDGSYPAHITALLERDLLRMLQEVGLDDIAFDYSHSGRLPGTARHVPNWLSRRMPRRFSDNILVTARKPGI